MLHNFFFEMPTNDGHDNKGAAAIALKLPKDKWKQHWAPPTDQPTLCRGTKARKPSLSLLLSGHPDLQILLEFNYFFLKIRSLPPGHKKIDICVQTIQCFQTSATVQL